ncbi:MAG: GNAT family N-acetyltransferase [Planctomycetes bacterium]|nr:GNAT family N-acetyltransferase [Planctomycetota bacterium]MCK5472562.1 GNAT family N-acetyltransferase [Planctomycetota bacterium]
MKFLEIRYQKISDAKRFVEILSHPDFIYFPAKPKTIKEEKDFLRKNIEMRKNGTAYNFSVILKGKLIGGAGIRIDQSRKYIAETGYFIDRKYWGRGIATAAVKLVEDFALNNLKLQLKRIEILTLKKNKASQRVAIKCGYRKEGIQRGKVAFKDKYLDAYSYAKII